MRNAAILVILFLVGYATGCVVQGSDTAVYLTRDGTYLLTEAITENAAENEGYYYSDECLVYRGHYGDYLVSLCSDQFGDSVRINYRGEAPEEDAIRVLPLELKWLADHGVIAGLTDKDIGEIGAVLSKKEGYAVYDEGWISIATNCNPDGKCYRCGPAMETIAGATLPSIEELVLPIPGMQQPAAEKGIEEAFGVGVTEGGVDRGEEELGVEPLFLYASLAIALAAIVGTILFQISRQRVVTDIEVHKALSSETRIGILNDLSDVERIPTDLSSRLGKSKATISEHLERLVEAGLVEKMEVPGKKFVYYRITSRGKDALRRMAA